MWPADGKPMLVRPDDKVVELRVEGHVPVLDDSREVFPQEKYRKDKQLKKLFAMPTSQSCPAQESKDDELLGELVPEDDSHEYARSRKPGDLIAEAASAKHQFTHFPALLMDPVTKLGVGAISVLNIQVSTVQSSFVATA